MVAAYLIGAIPVGYVVARVAGVDIRRHGSGNIGATNVLRTLGRGAAIGTLVADVAKGYVAVWVGGLGAAEATWIAVAAFVAVVGNCWSVFLRFRGGKGVATGLGVFLNIAPLALVPAVVTWIVLLASFRFVSLASVCAVFGFPLAVFWFGYALAFVGAAAGIAVLIIARHRGNIERLVAGTERRLGEREAASV